MINRRHIRVKVMQSAYSFLISGNEDTDRQEKFLKESISRLHQLYTFHLQILVALYDRAVVQSNAVKKNFIKTDSLLVNSLNFVNNRVLIQLKNSETLGNYPIDKADVNWGDNKEIIEQLWLKVQRSKTFDAYMHLPSTDYNEDRTFVVELFNKHIAPNEKLFDFYEAEVISWVDDIPFVNTWVLKNIRSFTKTTQFNPDGLYKDVEDKAFAIQLFRKTVLNFSKYEADIDKKTPNWDSERITKVDKILMVMAIVEFIDFPSIPTKVTINEYIEIAKDYATAKSSYFINGVLDKLLEGYQEENKINKTGRGLI